MENAGLIKLETVMVCGEPGKISKIERYNWKNIKSGPGTYMEISKVDLSIDTSYQRAISKKKVYSMAHKWSWPSCGTLTVVKRKDGSFFIVNGQHRHAAAMLRSDVKALPCLVFELKEDAEAAVFIESNTTFRALCSFDKYKALLKTGDQLSIKIERLLSDTGWKVVKSSTEHGSQIACISSLMDCGEKDYNLLEDIWLFISEFFKGQGLIDAKTVSTLFYLEKNLRVQQRSFVNEKDLRNRIINAGL